MIFRSLKKSIRLFEEVKGLLYTMAESNSLKVGKELGRRPPPASAGSIPVPGETGKRSDPLKERRSPGGFFDLFCPACGAHGQCFLLSRKDDPFEALSAVKAMIFDLWHFVLFSLTEPAKANRLPRLCRRQAFAEPAALIHGQSVFRRQSRF